MIAPGLAALTRAFGAGAADPVEALEHALATIEAQNPALNAVVGLDAEGARSAAEASAARWRARAPLSPVDGAPVGAKANVAIQGLSWTAAIAAFADRIAAHDAFVVKALREAGAVVLASLNMHEGALGATTTSPLYGPCWNPLRQGYVPGGSSGGSAAAVAAGMIAGAIGTDTMGSVRIPAAYTGTCGFKPSFGRLSRTGVELLSPSLDHVGVHGRSVEDCLVLFDALDRPDPEDDYAAPRRRDEAARQKLRVGVLLTSGVAVDSGIADAFDRAVSHMAALGWSVGAAALTGYEFSRMRRKGLLVLEAEGAALFADARAARPEGFSSEFTAMLDYGARQSALKLAQAQIDLAQTRRLARRLFEDFDILACPTAPQTAFAREAPTPDNQADLTAFANFAGLPAVALAIGDAGAGLPASLQILAAHGRDHLALAAANALDNHLRSA